MWIQNFNLRRKKTFGRFALVIFHPSDENPLLMFCLYVRNESSLFSTFFLTICLLLTENVDRRLCSANECRSLCHCRVGFQSLSRGAGLEGEGGNREQTAPAANSREQPICQCSGHRCAALRKRSCDYD